MKKFWLLTTALIILSCHTGICATNNDYAQNVNKIEQYIIAENIYPTYQNYIIFSKKPIKKVFSNDKNIANAYVLTTIDNSRDTIIIEANSIGKTQLTAIVDDQNITIEVNVTKSKTYVKTNYELFEALSLDTPDELSITEGA